MERLNVGVDWGHEHVQFAVESADGKVVWSRRCEAIAPEVRDVVQHLRELAAEHGTDRIAMAIERRAGRLVELLLAAGVEVWFVRPAQVDDARHLRFSSKAKDDLRDARTMAWMLRAMPESLTRVELPPEREVELQRLTRARARLVKDRTALLNQVIELFREVFPEILAVSHPSTRWFTALWRLVRTPDLARSVPLEQIGAILRKHRVRKVSAPEVARAFASAETFSAHGDWTLEAELMLDHLALVEQQITRLEERIEERLQELREQAPGKGPSDVEIVNSLSGAGSIVTATMIGEGLPHLLLSDLQFTRAYTGVAPIRDTTGKRQTRGQGSVMMRYACNLHLRHALHLLVEKGMVRDPWMKQRYAELRARGHTHGRACRQLADGLLHRLRAMLRDRRCYEPPLRVEALAS